MVKNPSANAGDTGSNPDLEDPACRGATKPVSHNYCACVSGAREPQLLKPAHLEPVLRNKRSHCNKKSAHRNEE